MRIFALIISVVLLAACSNQGSVGTTTVTTTTLQPDQLLNELSSDVEQVDPLDSQLESLGLESFGDDLDALDW